MFMLFSEHNMYIVKENNELVGVGYMDGMVCVNACGSIVVY